MIPDGLPDSCPVKRVHLIPVLHSPQLSPRATTPTVLSPRRPGRRDGTPFFTSTAVPRTRGHGIEIDTVRVVRHVAAVTEQQQLLIIRLPTVGTRLEVRKVIVDIIDDHRRVDVWNLDTVLHGVR